MEKGTLIPILRISVPFSIFLFGQATPEIGILTVNVWYLLG